MVQGGENSLHTGIVPEELEPGSGGDVDAADLPEYSVDAGLAENATAKQKFNKRGSWTR